MKLYRVYINKVEFNVPIFTDRALALEEIRKYKEYILEKGTVKVVKDTPECFSFIYSWNEHRLTMSIQEIEANKGRTYLKK